MSRRALTCLVLILLCVAPLPRQVRASCCLPEPQACCVPEAPCCDPFVSVEPNDAWARAAAPPAADVLPEPAVEPSLAPALDDGAGADAVTLNEPRPRSTHPPPRRPTPVTLATVLLR